MSWGMIFVGAAFFVLGVLWRAASDANTRRIVAAALCEHPDEAWVRRLIREELDAEGVWLGAHSDRGTLTEQRRRRASERNAAIAAGRREEF